MRAICLAVLPLALASPPELTRPEAAALLSQWLASSSKSGHSLQITKLMALHGSQGKSYLLRFQWMEDGRSLPGLMVAVHTSAYDGPWMAKHQEWGLPQNQNDFIINSLKGAKASLNESMTISDIRTIISGQAAFSSLSGGAYGELRCLSVPADCVPGYMGPRLLDPETAAATEQDGYRRTFHRGPKFNSGEGTKAGAPPMLAAYAYTAVPIAVGESGQRGFCGDSSGRICFTTDGTRPAVKDGLCAASCSDLK